MRREWVPRPVGAQQTTHLVAILQVRDSQKDEGDSSSLLLNVWGLSWQDTKAGDDSHWNHLEAFLTHLAVDGGVGWDDRNTSE